MESLDFLVCVRCFTFNHAKYIEDAMNGFTMQQTDFPFVCVIVDDASTDGEPEIIRNYLQKYFILSDDSVINNKETDDYLMTFAQHKTNNNCFFAVYLLKYNHHSLQKSKFSYFKDYYDNIKYYAFCEGDDFWVKIDKLKKEVDYLEEHKDKSLVYTNCNVLFEEEKQLYKDVFSSGFLINAYNYKDFILKANYLAPCTWLGTRQFRDIQTPSNVIDGTLYIGLTLFRHNSIGYLNETTATYRVVHDGASHSKDLYKRYNYYKNVLSTYRMFIEKDFNIFSEEELDNFYYKKYRHILPYASALGDKTMLKEVLNHTKTKMDYKGEMMLSLSRCYFIRRVIGVILQHRISHGL